jgi:peroxiredoxin
MIRQADGLHAARDHVQSLPCNSGRGRSVADRRPQQNQEKPMTIKVGDRMPEGSFGIMTSEGPGSLSSEELFAGKKVVLFAVPGAFTPTCSMSHLPGFVEHAAAIKAKGVDAIACMSVNDLFVMDAWGKDKHAGDKVLMLADGNGTYTEALGLELDASKFGMGKRSQRFAIIVDDGVVSELLVEAPGKFEASKAETVLGKL